MKSFFRFLYKNKLYTVIEVAGMAVAIAFVLFIGTFLIGEFTADSEIKKQGDIYVGASENMYMCSATIKEQVEGKFPEITGICRTLWTYTLRGLSMEMTAGELDEPFAQDALITDKEFFTMLPFPLAEGNPDDVLQQKHSVVLSESFARRAFPGRSPLGENIKISINGTDEFLTVTGVFRDFRNSIFHSPDIIYGTDIIMDLFPGLLRNGNGTATIFYKVADGTDIAMLSEKVRQVVKENDILYVYGMMQEYKLVPFDAISTSELSFTVPFEGVVPMDFIRLFLAAGILLLVFAVLNYVSLTVAQTGFRAKEMASRRLVGAQRSAIVARYVLESFILTCISFVLALLITALASEPFSTLIGKEVAPLAAFDAAEICFMAGLVVLLSLCSGIVPAIIVSKYRPIDIVKGNLAARAKMSLGKFLITCQSIVAIGTLSVSAVMFLQIRHMVSRPMGYGTDGRIMVAGAQRAADYLVDELKSIPGVEDAGWLQNAPMDNVTTGATLTKNGKDVKLDLFYCDPKAFEILGFEAIKVCQGNVEGGIWLPESAVAGLGLDYDSMEVTFDETVLPLCGIMKDFRKGGAGSDNNNGYITVPLIVNMYSEDDAAYLRQLVVKVTSDEDDAAERIAEFYRERENGIKVTTYNGQVRHMYFAEDRNMKLVGLFTLLTLLLTSMAMLAMSTYFTRQRTKETAVKKVMGCDRRRIFSDTANGFLVPVWIAAVVSVPFAWFLAGRWLEGYSYRIDNGLWIYIAAAAAMAVIAVASISWQTIKLMNTDPAEALKNE